jgi:hypothetical protein
VQLVTAGDELFDAAIQVTDNDGNETVAVCATPE